MEKSFFTLDTIEDEKEMHYNLIEEITVDENKWRLLKISTNVDIPRIFYLVISHCTQSDHEGKNFR
jgi:hypothetical protein